MYRLYMLVINKSQSKAKASYLFSHIFAFVIFVTLELLTLTNFTWNIARFV